MGESLICPTCAKPIPATATFCRRCGHRLHAAPKPLTPIVSPPQKTAGGFMIFVFVAAAVVALLVAVLFRSVRQSSRTATMTATFAPTPAPVFPRTSGFANDNQLPPLPPLPKWERHLPADLPAKSIGTQKDFRGLQLGQSRFIGEALHNVVFAGADLTQATFEKTDLKGADFRGAYLLQTNFAGADFTDARFDEAQFAQASFIGNDTAVVAGKTRIRNGITESVPPPPLPAKNVGKASFRNTRFMSVKLTGLDLKGGDFQGASFSSVDFNDADLRGADLRDTRHQSTDFKGAQLDGADLRGADLSYARNLTPAQLGTARTDETTRMPRY